jgi:hypothetical protein
MTYVTYVKCGPSGTTLTLGDRARPGRQSRGTSFESRDLLSTGERAIKITGAPVLRNHPQYAGIAWWLTRNKIGRSLREHYEAPAELPASMLALIRKLDRWKGITYCVSGISTP